MNDFYFEPLFSILDTGNDCRLKNNFIPAFLLNCFVLWNLVGSFFPETVLNSFVSFKYAV